MRDYIRSVLFLAKFRFDCYMLSPLRGEKPRQYRFIWANFELWGSPIMAKFGVQDCTLSILFLSRFRFDRYILSPRVGKIQPYNACRLLHGNFHPTGATHTHTHIHTHIERAISESRNPENWVLCVWLDADDDRYGESTCDQVPARVDQRIDGRQVPVRDHQCR